MNRNHLAVFHAVAEAGSFSRGAERLMVSQPAVSLQVGELERSLNLKLFDRLSKGIRLTAAGETLFAYARRIAALEAEADRAVLELKGLARGRLSVGASLTVGVYLLPEVFGDYRRRFPGVELDLAIANTRDVQQKLIDGGVEVGLTEGSVEHGDLDVTVFREDELVAIAPPGHPLARRKRLPAAAVVAEPVIFRETGSGTREVVEAALAQRGLKPNVTMSLGSTEAIKRAVAAGVGLAIVSRLAIDAEVEAGRLVVLPLADLRIRRPLHLLRRRGVTLSPAASAFVALLTGAGRKR